MPKPLLDFLLVATLAYSLKPQPMVSVSWAVGPGIMIYRLLTFEFSLDSIIPIEILTSDLMPIENEVSKFLSD